MMMNNMLRAFIAFFAVLITIGINIYAVHLIANSDSAPGWDSVGWFLKGWIILLVIGVPAVIFSAVKLIQYIKIISKEVRNNDDEKN